MSYSEISEPLISGNSNIFTPAWFQEFSRPVWSKARAAEFMATMRGMQPIVPLDISWMPTFPSVIAITYAAVPCGQGMGRGD